jgi:TetR/AcrR family transcriptional repressor of mexCD-oprJ operon
VTRLVGQQAEDHRRVRAQRNVAAILDATERLLQRGTSLSIAAVASESGLSRVTVYAHFAGLPELVEAVVERTVRHASAAIDEADPDTGPAGAALSRVLAAAWNELDRQGAMARASAEHVPPERLKGSHHALLSRLRHLIERGQREGAFRPDLPTDWLVSVFYALLHAASDDVRAERATSAEAFDRLRTTLDAALCAPSPPRRRRATPRQKPPASEAPQD